MKAVEGQIKDSKYRNAHVRSGTRIRASSATKQTKDIIFRVSIAMAT